MRVFIRVGGFREDGTKILGVYSSYDKLMDVPVTVRKGIAHTHPLSLWEDGELWEVDGERLFFEDGV